MERLSANAGAPLPVKRRARAVDVDRMGRAVVSTPLTATDAGRAPPRGSPPRRCRDRADADRDLLDLSLTAPP